VPHEAGRTLRARIPDHVVHRDFPEETVVLNIETGRYHGLNYTARRMLAVLAEADSIGSAAAILAEEFGVSRIRIERDLLELCAALSARGLLELYDAEAA
jgi:phosphohistidine swiveling domain-containing protein